MTQSSAGNRGLGTPHNCPPGGCTGPEQQRTEGRGSSRLALQVPLRPHRVVPALGPLCQAVPLPRRPSELTPAPVPGSRSLTLTMAPSSHRPSAKAAGASRKLLVVPVGPTVLPPQTWTQSPEAATWLLLQLLAHHGASHTPGPGHWAKAQGGARLPVEMNPERADSPHPCSQSGGPCSCSVADVFGHYLLPPQLQGGTLPFVEEETEVHSGQDKEHRLALSCEPGIPAVTGRVSTGPSSLSSNRLRLPDPSSWILLPEPPAECLPWEQNPPGPQSLPACYAPCTCVPLYTRPLPGLQPPRGGVSVIPFYGGEN